MLLEVLGCDVSNLMFYTNRQWVSDLFSIKPVPFPPPQNTFTGTQFGMGRPWYLNQFSFYCSNPVANLILTHGERASHNATSAPTLKINSEISCCQLWSLIFFPTFPSLLNWNTTATFINNLQPSPTSYFLFFPPPFVSQKKDNIPRTTIPSPVNLKRNVKSLSRCLISMDTAAKCRRTHVKFPPRKAVIVF